MNIENMVCVGPRVMVEVEPPKKTSEGGIVIPDSVLEKEHDSISEGILIKIGDTAFKEWAIKPPAIGSKVYFVKYAGKELVMDEKYYRVINDEDIYACHKEEVANDH